MKTTILMSVLVAQVSLANGALELELSAAELTGLQREIAAAKKAHPEAFQRVATIQRDLAVIDAKKRGRFAAITPLLESIPDATWAIAEAVALTGHARDVAPSAQIAWQTGLLEALGAQNDPKTEPILMAALASAGRPEVLRSAADGLGRLGTDRAAATLIAAATHRTGAEREAVLSGMGSCHRLAIATFLSRQLATSTADSERRALVKGLSRVGNEWALQTPAGSPVKSELPALRQTAAAALVKLFAESSGRVRQEASDAILIVNAPETKVLLAQVRVKDPAAVDALIAKTH